MRLFFAIELDDGVKDAMQRSIDGIALNDVPWRWVKRDNFHLTMKFLGDCPDSDIPLLEKSAAAVTRSESFDIALGKLGGFPDLARPRVLFYEVSRGHDALERLAALLSGALEADLGIVPEKRRFTAHATVARIKSAITDDVAGALQQVAPVDGVSQRVTHLTLMRSELGSQGAIYHQVKEFALKKSK